MLNLHVWPQRWFDRKRLPAYVCRSVGGAPPGTHELLPITRI